MRLIGSDPPPERHEGAGSYHARFYFIHFSSFVDILILMDVLGGFAPATVAAPGAISLKRFQPGDGSLEWDSGF
jgi:hypothetical protein